MEHLSEPELAAYRARSLEPDVLLRATDHLAECEHCRAQLRRSLLSGAAINGLREKIESHLSADQLQRFVSSELDPQERAPAEQHLAWCADCQSDVRGLREFARASTPRVVKVSRPAWPRWLAAAAAVVALAFGIGLWTQRPAIVAAVNDSGGRITLDAKGNLAGVSGVTGEQLAAVRQAMRGDVPAIAANLSALQPPRGALLGQAPPANFRVLAPVGTLVPSARPEFRWTARALGATYVVTIKNLASGQVINSPRLQALNWMPKEPLEPGTTYAWQVAATAVSSEEIAPAPPNPQARFQILTPADAARLRTLPASHLVRAVVYLQSGLLDDAEQEARALEQQNPGSKVANDLRQRIQTSR